MYKPLEIPEIFVRNKTTIIQNTNKLKGIIQNSMYTINYRYAIIVKLLSDTLFTFVFTFKIWIIKVHALAQFAQTIMLEGSIGFSTIVMKTRGKAIT